MKSLTITPAKVAEPELTGDLLGGAEVHLVGGLLGVVLDPEVARVDVDRHQGLGLVDDDRAALGQGDVPALDLGDLVLDAVLVEERHFFVVELDPVDEPGHDHAEELLGALEGRRLVDPDRIDLGGEDVADGPGDHVRFLVDRARGPGSLDPPEDHLPEPQQVGQVASQLALGAFQSGGPDDEAQALGRVQLVHDLAELAALAFIDDLA